VRQKGNRKEPVEMSLAVEVQRDDTEALFDKSASPKLEPPLSSQTDQPIGYSLDNPC